MLGVTAKSLQRLRCKIPPPWGRHYATESTTTNASTTTDGETNVVKSSFKDVTIPSMTVTEFVWELMDRWPDRTAIVCGITGRNYTYAQLRERCRKFAASLQRMKLEPGSKLGIILPNCPDYPAVTLGAIEAGLIVNTFNPVYIPIEISKQIVEVNPRIIVTFPEKYQQVVEATTLAAAGAGYRPPLYVVVQALERSDVPTGAVDGREMMEKNMDAVTLAGHKASPDSQILIPYSSGTTRWPKGVMLSHRNVVACGNQMNDEPKIKIADYTSGTYQDVMMAVLPFYHIYGLAIILFSKLRCGAMIVTVPTFDANTFIKTLEKHKVTVLCMVPPLVQFMGAHPSITKDAVPSLRTIVCGAAALMDMHVIAFMQRFPHINFMQGYGMTENTASVTITPRGNTKRTSVGRCVSNTMAKVIDITTGVNMEAGGMGEICVKGPQVMLGYSNNAQATAETIDKLGWLHTGDLGYYDKDHDFYIVDRLKELIKVKGFQVAPAELEELLRSHPDVVDAAVIGISDPESGELPFAYVVAKPTANTKDLEQNIIEFVKSRVSSFKHIKTVRFVKQIPRTPTGKTLYKDIRKWLKEEQP